jgi:hydrogenase maturation factor
MCLGEVATVVGLDPMTRTATVRGTDRERVVSVALQHGVQVGDRVVVHTGFVVDVLAPVPEPRPARDEGRT